MAIQLLVKNQMNTTILHLFAISSLSSPSFQLTHQSVPIHFTLSNSFFSHSFNSFLNTPRCSKYSLIFTNSKFSNFLNTVIDTDGSSISQPELLESQPILSTYVTSKNKFTVRSCTFVNCTSKISGGALVIARNCHESNVNWCTFLNCSCNYHGGAIYSESSRFWSSYCCFSLCNCTNSSYGASIYSKTDGEVSLIFSSFFQSPINYPTPVENGVLYLKGGNQRLNNQNYSMNYGTLFGGPVSEDSAALVIRAITLFDQIAGSMMGFYSVKEKHEISMGNIVNCSCLYGVFRLENTQLVISEFVFLNNDANLTTTHFLKPSSTIPIGESALLLNQCVFNQPNIRDGDLKVIKRYCLFNRTQRTSLRLQMMNTEICEGVPFTINILPLIYILGGITALSILLAICFKKFESKQKEQ